MERYRFCNFMAIEMAIDRPFISKIPGKMRFIDSCGKVYEYNKVTKGYLYLYKSFLK